MFPYDVRCVCGHKPHQKIKCTTPECLCEEFIRTDVAIARALSHIAAHLGNLVQIGAGLTQLVAMALGVNPNPVPPEEGDTTADPPAPAPESVPKPPDMDNLPQDLREFMAKQEDNPDE